MSLTILSSLFPPALLVLGNRKPASFQQKIKLKYMIGNGLRRELVFKIMVPKNQHKDDLDTKHLVSVSKDQSAPLPD